MSWKFETIPAQIARYNGATCMALGSIVTLFAGAKLYYELNVHAETCAYASTTSNCPAGDTNPEVVTVLEEITIAGATMDIIGLTAYVSARKLDQRLITRTALECFDTQSALLLNGQGYELGAAPKDIVDQY